MKQPEDNKTMDFLNSEKRGRGRPRLPDALSDAQRARRYREKKQSRPAAIKRDAVTGNGSSTSPSRGMLESRVMLLNAENLRLSEALREALDRIAALEKALMRASGINVTRHGKPPSKKPVRNQR